ncbi:hypothetical protein [Haloarcula marina]|uniref:hypothetical protein n=1 Tax=Haloarcula marina TaxID=2961574 RepID=UPI0020B69DD6|nr:hypothetical protein [Halomicroarcula marina]
MDWVARAGDLLYDGESIQEHVRVDEAGVVVTTHRVLAFTPNREGANFQQVDRPNVDGVELASGGETAFLEQGAKAGVAGVALLGASQFVNLDGLAAGVSMGGGATGAAGLGQMMGLLQTMLGLMARLDDIMLLFGGLALAFAVVPLGVYLWSRERLLVVSVAGGEDIELPAPGDDAVVDDLRAALWSEGPGNGGHASSVPDDPLA